MKVIALGSLSGAVGNREKGDEFVVDAKAGAALVARGLVEEITTPAPLLDKAAKPKE
ncbi:hypothetical protein [Pseudomonas psychrophila]|uniref:Uncharacterized protein n=1 Tax=Pseudomonas psychrophila TaxID=122355 RepID=A0A8I1KAW5_9PSED|nr:hypothetical protein [Pseudomonas psychrophila]MBJ2259108.1 hypothetical protein [Pseudomonas psychrophila]